MSSLSVSFTLGKASVPHEANVPHVNRKFIAKNVNEKKTHENITYKMQDVHDAYEELFSESVEQYNNKQKQPCRKIKDYYSHIANGKREEAFYEAIVQFGDNKTAPCGSENGKAAVKMLDEYIRNFQKRNPNLYVFNAVLHMDEASPHLHINFIPFYTKNRKNGLSKGVSMKAALDEQGFKANNFKENRLVAWEESERIEMEKILIEHGYQRDDKNAKYSHLTVEEFKKSQDEKKIVEALRQFQKITSNDLQIDRLRKLKQTLSFLEMENKDLNEQKLSPYKSFFYSSPEKQAYVQSRLDELKIPYRETENGLEAQEYLIEKIRKIEKEYKPHSHTIRDDLRETVDRILMQSDSFEEFLDKMKKEKYEIKTGKYLAFKPRGASNFIRTKSLGAYYGEYALRNRISEKKKFEKSIDEKINAAKKDTPEIIVAKTIRFYIVAFKDGALPMRRNDHTKPFSWTNDRELDKLSELNRKINAGATLESLKNEFEKAPGNNKRRF